MEYRRVALVGAGAIGSYLIWGLSRKEGIELKVIAEGERKERYQRNGFVINGERFDPEVCTAEEAKGADLIVVSVKYDALREACKEIQDASDEHTTIISFMNGIDSEEIIGEYVNPSQIIPAMIRVQSERTGNQVRFNPETCVGMIYGELDPTYTERTDALNRLFEGTGLHYSAVEHILSEIWKKFWLNIGNNQPQAMLGVGMGAYRDSEHVDYIRTQLRREVELLAEAKGVDLRLATGFSFQSKDRDDARFSTLQDLDAKRHTEVGMFAGTVVRLGRELGIPTPWNEMTYHMIRALEEKNDGKFDY